MIKKAYKGVAVTAGYAFARMPSTVAPRLIARRPKTRLRLKQFGRLMLHIAKRHNVSAMIR